MIFSTRVRTSGVRRRTGSTAWEYIHAPGSPASVVPPHGTPKRIYPRAEYRGSTGFADPFSRTHHSAKPSDRSWCVGSPEHPIQRPGHSKNLTYLQTTHTS